MAIYFKLGPALNLNQIFRPIVLQIRTRKKQLAFQQFRRKNNAEEIAKDYFDINYVKIFQNEWPAIRSALLSRKKYCAILNHFVDTDSYEEQLSSSGAYDFIAHCNKKAELRIEELQRLIDNDINNLAVLQNTRERDGQTDLEVECEIDELEKRLEYKLMYIQKVTSQNLNSK